MMTARHCVRLMWNGVGRERFGRAHAKMLSMYPFRNYKEKIYSFAITFHVKSNEQREAGERTNCKCIEITIQEINDT